VAVYSLQFGSYNFLFVYQVKISFIYRGGNFTLPTNETISYIGTWTYEGCLPVSRATSSEKYGNEILSFFDIIVGIGDPNVFIPRQECLTEQEYAMRNILFGTAIKKNE